MYIYLKYHFEAYFSDSLFSVLRDFSFLASMASKLAWQFSSVQHKLPNLSYIKCDLNIRHLTHLDKRLRHIALLLQGTILFDGKDHRILGGSKGVVLNSFDYVHKLYF